MKLADKELLVAKGKCIIDVRHWGKQEFIRYDISKQCKKYLNTDKGQLFFKDIAEYKFVEVSLD